MPLRIGFFKDFNGFWKQNGAMLASKIEQKSMLSSRGDFLKKHRFFLRKKMILKDPGVEVGSKNLPKIDLKSSSTWEGILASILHGFCSTLEAKLALSWHRNSIKNFSEKALKKDAKKKQQNLQKSSS